MITAKLCRFCFFTLLSLIMFSCSSTEVKKDRAGYNSSSAPDYREYEKEGFITEDIYRVVIVEPVGGAERDTDSVLKTAKRRARTSMQKHLTMSGKIINNNAKARLLNLINDHGELRETKRKYETKRVYLFDVKKPGLRQYLEGIAPAR